MNSKLKIVIRVVLLLAVVGGAVWWFFFRPKPEAKLVLSGSIEANTVQVGSLLGGRVQRAQVAQALAELARVKRGPREEEVRQARINYESAEVDRKRFQALWEAGAIARRDYEATQVKAANARETLLAAQRGGPSEDVAAAAAVVAQGRERLAFLERQHQELVVTAPATGRV